MRCTVNGPYRSGIGYVRKDNKLGMVQDGYKLGNALNGIATHVLIVSDQVGGARSDS